MTEDMVLLLFEPFQGLGPKYRNQTIEGRNTEASKLWLQLCGIISVLCWFLIVEYILSLRLLYGLNKAGHMKTYEAVE